jgi:hypothetical protein
MTLFMVNLSFFQTITTPARTVPDPEHSGGAATIVRCEKGSLSLSHKTDRPEPVIPSVLDPAEESIPILPMIWGNFAKPLGLIPWW